MTESQQTTEQDADHERVDRAFVEAMETVEKKYEDRLDATTFDLMVSDAFGVDEQVGARFVRGMEAVAEAWAYGKGTSPGDLAMIAVLQGFHMGRSLLRQDLEETITAALADMGSRNLGYQALQKVAIALGIETGS